MRNCTREKGRDKKGKGSKGNDRENLKCNYTRTLMVMQMEKRVLLYHGAKTCTGRETKHDSPP